MIASTYVYRYNGHWRNPLSPARQYCSRIAATMAMLNTATDLLASANEQLNKANANPDPDVFTARRLDAREYVEGSFPVDPDQGE